MDIKALRYFLAIVDYGSLTKAAEVVGVAQPALSQQLTALEAEFDVQLLHRSSKGIALTNAGRVLYRHACTILRQLSLASDDVKSIGAKISGKVSIGLPPTVAARLVMPLIKAVRERFPEVRLQIFEGLNEYMLERFFNQRLDFIFLFRSTGSQTIEALPLAQEALSLIGYPEQRLLRVDQPDTAPIIPIENLGSLPLVLPGNSQEGLRHQIEEVFAQRSIDVNVVVELDSLKHLLECAREGLACTILPTSVLVGENANLPHYQIQPEIRRSLSLCWLRSAQLIPAAHAVKEVVQEITGQLVNTGELMSI
ncbi:MAG: transcriptional regulator, LysR family [Glomeribacter sp. 1016415]|uniref:LysR family regulatory protein n=1 Tax=Mycoavidus cysteinexigens TaxID=1553431 RepID=A0A2Z6ET99_9BURK|nr:LysR substrate-binding domain-containing protein [Mycoavidus cysteinexigens]MCX8565711.1 transcriptional regulator, LysR family [Glomeribacter sp. 1016415]BBE08639.1 LysR family regulatory protein [Mycoavidus cysteinexigens]GAM52656.1 transcriptional regulator [bacterium endosymbiont of Mortierella elongata FMR23-6]GLR01497.1 LysR family transcriptional regulator [Mycoavidus cysteinexigens]